MLQLNSQESQNYVTSLKGASCLIMILLHIVSHTLFRGHSVLLPAQASSMSMERLFIQLSDDVYISKLTSMTGFVLQGHICIA